MRKLKPSRRMPGRVSRALNRKRRSFWLCIALGHPLTAAVIAHYNEASGSSRPTFTKPSPYDSGRLGHWDTCSSAGGSLRWFTPEDVVMFSEHATEVLAELVHESCRRLDVGNRNVTVPVASSVGDAVIPSSFLP